jgi:hypothetical protein
MAMTKKTTTPKPQKGPKLESTYETEIEFMCPVRGLVKQKVKVKKYQSTEIQQIDDIRTSNNLTDQLDLKYSGLMLDDDSVKEDETN